MPDKWEYPWYAAWDLAFHCIAIALIDPEFAKDQLILMYENGIYILMAKSPLMVFNLFFILIFLLYLNFLF